MKSIVHGDTKKLIQVVFLILILVCLAASSFAFDGNRKGFVLGGGIGLAPVSRFSVGNYHEDGLGVGVNFVIGYGLDNQNLIVYEGNVSYRNSELFSKTGWETEYFFDGGTIGNQMIGQGFNGAAWYHYFTKKKNSFFSTLGAGVCILQTSDFGSNDFGFGFLVGGGYAFSRHWQVGSYFVNGKTSNGYLDFNHTQLTILFGYIGF
jgi:hypothetical protein